MICKSAFARKVMEPILRDSPGLVLTDLFSKCSR